MSSRLTLIIFLSVLPRLSFAQNDVKVKTDSSIITTKYHSYLNTIDVFNDIKGKRKTYFTEYYFDNKKLKQRGIFLNGDCYGIWKEFWPDGKLKRQIDYQKGIITFSDKKAYPYNDYLNTLKLKGDAIIKKFYGQEFFNKYVTWDINHSVLYNGTQGYDWTDSSMLKPSGFMVRYSIKFEGINYPEIFELSMDADGKFIPSAPVKGLENLPTNSLKNFKITTSTAIKTARQKGLSETLTAKAVTFLTWDTTGTSRVRTGHFRFNVLIKTQTTQHLSAKGRSAVIDKFDMYIFNPWTAEFIGKRKMKAYRGWEASSGSSSGLMPDN